MECPTAGSDDDGATAAVCCMCGDHGLPDELFQCGLCRLRLQHRYCSELYPREAAYRSCNWCLREDAAGARGRNPAVNNTPRAAALKRGLVKEPRADSGDLTSPSSGGCSRSAFSAEPGNPVKKPKKNKAAGRTTEQWPLTAGKGRRAVHEGTGRTTRFSRVKVRRYKLLAEVIC